MTPADTTADTPVNAHAEPLRTLLGLRHEPVAVAFLDHPPDAPSPDSEEEPVEPVAAGCCFWAPGERERLVTRPADHAGCSVGGYVHGLVPLETAAGADDVAALVGTGWVTPADLTAAPVVDRTSEAIVYEPLATAASADVVLLRLTARELVRLQGAVPEVELVAKPQCQIVAHAVAGRATVSPGCAVSRVRTGLPADELTVALPAASLGSVVERLVASTAADDAAGRLAGAGQAPPA